MDIFPVLLLLLSCRIQAVGAQINLSPKTQTVISGEEARFTCSISNTQWTVMVWLLNGTVALVISHMHGVLPPINLNATAEKSPASRGDTWVFVLKNTERQHQGEVTCDLQGIGSKTASLFVQEKGSVRVFGETRLAFQGQSVVFECEAVGWYPEPLLQWKINDRKMGHGDYNISTEETRSSLFTVTSNLSMTAEKSSIVDCLASVSALTTPLKSSVRLTVVAEVVQEADGCIVPVAVMASLSALLLLLLLCICTVLWYRQRRRAKPSPQEVIRFDQSVSGRISVAEATKGRVNLGFSTEGPTDADYNELVTGMTEFATFHKVPDVVSSRSVSLQSDNQDQESAMNIRRITTV